VLQGHVDNVGVIEEMRPDGDSLYVRVRPPADLLPYIVPKGFIAIDGASVPSGLGAVASHAHKLVASACVGTSLTVCEVNKQEGWFEFMLIEFTQQKVIIPKKAVGETVNLEVDVIAKYVENSLASVVERLEALEAKVSSLS
jgi:riboflavin synthase